MFDIDCYISPGFINNIKMKIQPGSINEAVVLLNSNTHFLESLWALNKLIFVKNLGQFVALF